MRYVLSVARHYLTGKLTGKHAAYALRERPVAVASKGKTWVIDPDFKGGGNAKVRPSPAHAGPRQ